MTDHLDRIRAEFARQAAQFDAYAPGAAPGIEDRFRAALGPAAGGRLLDVACGTGVIAAALAGAAAEVVGLDATDAMLERARARAAGHANLSFATGDAEALPFPDRSFDGVVTRLSLHHFADPARAVAEMARVLRPGGVAVVADVVSDPDAGKAALHNALEILRDPSHVRMMPVEEIAALLTGAGLDIAGTARWQVARGFDEWAAIVADPSRTAPLLTVMRALAAAGCDAGIGLSDAEGGLRFVHHWAMIAAMRPG